MLHVSLTDLVPKRDLDINGNHLHSFGTAQQEMTFRDDRLLKESQQLDQSLNEMSRDLHLISKRLQCLGREAMNAKGKAREVCNNAGTIQQTANAQIKECDETIGERNALAVVLLMKLLSLEEEAKEMRKQAEEGRKKCEELLCKLKELNSSKFSEYSLHVLNYCVFALKVKRR